MVFLLSSFTKVGEKVPGTLVSQQLGSPHLTYKASRGRPLFLPARSPETCPTGGTTTLVAMEEMEVAAAVST